MATIQIPSAVEMAKELIVKNPDVFHNDYKTQLLIAAVMRDYYEKCMAYTTYRLSELYPTIKNPKTFV